MHRSIRVRLFAAFLAVALFAAAGISLYSLSELESYALRKLEERLETEGHVASALVGAQYLKEPKALEERLLAQALRGVDPRISSRLRILGEDGRLIVDSGGDVAPGATFAERPEVVRAIGGSDGRASRITPDGRVALYVAVPIAPQGKVVGVAYVSSSTFSIINLLHSYRYRLLALVLIYVLVALLIAEGLARWLARPLDELERAAGAFAAGDHSIRVKPGGARETRGLAEGFNEMASTVEEMVGELRAEEERKSRFVSDVSHELRTPLTAIRGTAETLLAQDVAPEDRARFAGTIVREADRLARLADDLLTLERIEGGTGELRVGAVRLGEVVAAAAEALGPILAELEVSLEVDGDAPAVVGDADRLLQVVANLLDNASRVTPAGGSVRVELARADEQPAAVVTVADQGPGIPEADLPHVFDRFWRSESSRSRASGGAGLGLAIAKAIVVAHKGTIEAASLRGGGASFTLRLPALREPSPGEPSPGEPSP